MPKRLYARVVDSISGGISVVGSLKRNLLDRYLILHSFGNFHRPQNIVDHLIGCNPFQIRF